MFPWRNILICTSGRGLALRIAIASVTLHYRIKICQIITSIHLLNDLDTSPKSNSIFDSLGSVQRLLIIPHCVLIRFAIWELSASFGPWCRYQWQGRNNWHHLSKSSESNSSMASNTCPREMIAGSNGCPKWENQPAAGETTLPQRQPCRQTVLRES